MCTRGVSRKPSRILEEGAAADLAAKSADRAARKFASLALTLLAAWTTGAGHRGSGTALADSKRRKSDSSQRELSRPASDRARPRCRACLGTSGRTAGVREDPGRQIALKKRRRARRDQDPERGQRSSWTPGSATSSSAERISRRGVPQADSEFDRCLKRRGEALSLFLDEGHLRLSADRLLLPGPRAQGLKTERFADRYREYLDIRGKSTEDPLVPEVRNRAGAGR